jgi:FAD/FMN-containing dehydrogenase
MVLLEPGVTFDQLVPVLATHGLRLAMPLVPRRGKSVIASLLEREPLATPRFAWSPMEPLRTLEVVWGSGRALCTGNGHLRGETDEDWATGKVPIVAGGPGQLDFFRLVAGAQGSMGIATWASVKCEPQDAAQSIIVLTADRLTAIIPCLHELARIRFGDELFAMDAVALGQLLDADPGALPAWSLVVGIGGGSILADQKVAGRVADVRDIAARHGLPVRTELAGLDGPALLARLQEPSPEGSWRDRPGRGTREVFFLTTLDRVPVQLEAAAAAAGPAGLPGVYLQPVHQGAGLHCELLVPYDPVEPGAAHAAIARATTVGRAAFEAGAYFSRPYGEWSDWVFAADPATAALTRTIKDIFDPNHVMNPGKLCFPRGDA